MQEVWNKIYSWDDYEISTYGRIRSFKGRSQPKMLKQAYSERGYSSVSLCVLSVKTMFRIHRLVAETFIQNPENKSEVNHIDGNPKNNNVENLEWCTPSENMKHSYHVLGNTNVPSRTGTKGVLCPNSKKVIQSDLNGNFVKSWDSMMDVYRETGIHFAGISNACIGKAKTAGGFKWQFEEKGVNIFQLLETVNN